MANIQPARTKYRKVQKGRNRGSAKGCDTLAFGEYGIQALERAALRANELEAARIAINRHLKRRGKLWIRIFPDKPVSKKPIGVRMGKGKGDPEFWVSVVAPGTMLFELAGVPDSLARESFRLAANKLGVRTRMVSRNAQV